MKIKHYIVTYNNKYILNNCLESLLPVLEKYSKEEYQLYIINNHSNFSIEEKFHKYVEVLHNSVRPDFSTGHLSRNWNQAIINGFTDLENPNCNIVITNQNDCEFDGDFIPNLIEFHKQYSFIQFGAGDNFISYTADSIKKVGLWDERFCNIGHQEADYFLRQMIYNNEGASINDHKHIRVHNPITNNIIKHTTSGYDRNDVFHLESKKFHTISERVYIEKWGATPEHHAVNMWCYDCLKELTPKVKSFMYYPYFESKLPKETLEKNNYLI